MKNALFCVKGMDLQFFAKFEDIISQHADAFEGSNITETVTNLTTKLNELGYDVLFNNRKSAEFVPASRLNETIAQRDQFKSQVEELNTQLQQMKDAAKGNEALQAQLQQLMDKNNDLLRELEQTKINSEIMIQATDAINPKDLLAFINFGNIRVNSKGEVLGVESEIARLRSEKPYLFNNVNQAGKHNKGGFDPNNDKGDPRISGMNAMIRRAAGRF